MNRTTAHRGAGCSYWPSPPSHCLRVHTSGRLAKASTLVSVLSPSKPGVGEATPNAADFTKRVIEDESKYIMQTYARPEIVFTHAEGVRMYDAFGKEYLDFAAGIAVNALGHGDPRWLSAVTDQAAMLSHTSNLFHNVPQVQLARSLVETSFADKVFFSNSGTEANEAAIKFSRKHARLQAGVDPYDTEAQAPHKIVSFTSGFHGRTMGALALTYKTAYKAPFAPSLPGAVCIPYLDLEAAKQTIQKGRTAAVFVEPLQGEGGIIESTPAFLQGLRDLCDQAGALLVFDEIQCGLGRTGRLWAHQHFGVQPDIMTLAKPLAGGLPVGATLVTQAVADSMKPGDHGSTFAGSPLVTRAAGAVFDVIRQPDFLQQVTSNGERLKQGLRDQLSGNPHVKEVRGLGLIVGVQLDQPAGAICKKCWDEGLIVITAGSGDVVRLVPPLTVTEADVDECVGVLSSVINSMLS